MAEVENDTEEEVEYVVEDGGGRSGTHFNPLRPGKVKALRISNEQFTIYFYRRGVQEDARRGRPVEPMAIGRSVSRDSYLRLYRPAPDCMEIEIRSAA